MKKYFLAFMLLPIISHARPINWNTEIDTLMRSLSRYDTSFQNFTEISATFIAHACLKPGDTPAKEIRIKQAGVFQTPSNVESDCAEIRQKGFDIQCVGIDRATVLRIPYFERIQPMLPFEYYTTTTWRNITSMPDVSYQCHFGSSYKSVFMQSYTGSGNLQWKDKPRITSVNTPQGPISLETRTLTLSANIPGLQHKAFQHSILGAKPL